MTQREAADEAMHGSYVFPASYGQERLWFLGQLDPAADRAYHLRNAVLVTGSFDVALLRRALDVTVRRHEVLRTRFVLRNTGEPLAQVIAPAGHVPVRELDLTGRSDDEVWRALAADADEPFDLASGPLLRLSIARVGAEKHVLQLTMHHIVGDGWSLGVLVDELSTVSAALADGREPDLPELPIQYADFASWQREQETRSELREHLDFWRAALADMPQLDVPTDRPRPVRQSYRGARVPVRLPADLVASATELGRTEGATPYMVLLAAWQAVLGRVGGSTDFGVGTPVAGRNRPETEPLIGFFVNTVVLRADLSDSPTFRQLVHRVRERAFDAFLHQDVPFEKLVDDLVPDRDLSRSPLFQVWFAYHDTPRRALRLPGAEVEQLDIPSDTAAFDLALALQPAGAEVTGWLQYDSDLFDDGTARNLAGQWQTLLTAAAAEPTAPVWSLPLLTGPDLAQLRHMSGRDVETSEHGCLPDSIESWVRRSPEAPAVRCGTARLSYAELDRRASRLANWLRSRGVAPGQVVGVCLPRTGDLVAALLAVWKCGAAYLPLDPDTPEARREFMLADSDARLVLTEAELAAHEARIEAQPDTSPDVSIHPHGLAYLIYTSGSTGPPKGVLVTHQSIAALVTTMGSTVGLRPGDVWGAVTSLSFDVAALELFGPLATGGCVALLARGEVVDSGRLASQLTDLDVDVVQGTPALWRSLVAAGWQPRSGLRALCGGEALPVDLAAALTAGGARVWHVYGTTETTGWSIAAPLSATGSVDLGRPLHGEWTYVLDEHLEPAPLGVVGELYIGGIGVASGYHARPGLTAQRFVPDPSRPGQRLYRTGDLVRRLPNGDLAFLGRRDEQIEVRGRRVELGEVEAVLAGHPLVREAVVVARGEADQRRLIGYAVPVNPDRDPTAAELDEWARRRLPEYLVPSAFHGLAALPRTPNGEVDREALPDLTPRSRTDAAQPHTPLQHEILQVVRRLLGRDDVGLHDRFFEVGGNSMLAARLVAELRRVLDVRLTVRQIFELRTVAQIASAQAPSLPAVTPRPPDVEPVLSFDQQRLWLEYQLRRGLAYNIHGRQRLIGNLDVVALERSIRTILGRHEALRTRFPLVDGQPVQVVDDPDEEWRIAFEDVSGEADRDGAAKRLADEQAATVFDLAVGPLLRCLLVQVSDTEHLLSITVHHIVSDARSIDLFLDELATLYGVSGDVDAARLPPLPVQYRDYAVWQRNLLTGDAMRAQVDYWRRQLTAAPPATVLPVARRRVTAQGLVGGHVRSELPAAVTAALNELCRKHDATPYMALLAGMATVLRRWSGQDDLVIGVPATTRSDAALHHLIGVFLNTLPLRVDLSGDPAFAELLARVRKVAVDGYASHGEVPFDVLVNELQPPRDPTRTPLFQVVLNMVDIAEEKYRLPGVTVAGTEHPVQPSKLDLLLSVREVRDTLRFDLAYYGDRYDAAMMRTFMDQFCALLGAVADDPSRGILEYSLQGPDRETGSGVTEPAGPVSTPQLAIERRARRLPDQVAVIDGDGSWSYRQLSSAADRVAHALVDRGLGSTGQVGVMRRRTAGFVAAVLGCLKAEVPFAVVDAAMPEAARRLYATTLLDADPPDAGDSDVIDVRALLVTGTSTTQEPEADLTDQHTDWAVERFDLTENDRFAVLSGSSGTVVSALSTALSAGATLCVPDDATVADVDALVDWLERTAVSVVYLNPPLLRAIAARSPLPQLPRLRYAFVANAGDLTYHDVSLVARISASCDFVGVYRVARDGRPLAVHTVPDTWCQENTPLRVPLGTEVAGVPVDLVNPAGRPAATGEVGEICVAGRHTGDLARRLHDGTLELAYASTAAYLDPTETVAALRDLPDVHDAVVTEYVDTDGRTALAAYVASPDRVSSTTDIRQHLVTRVPEYLVPKTLLVLDRLPLDPDGEYDRESLPDPASAGAQDDSYVAPRTPVERQLTDIFEELLDVDRVGIHDTFFELNGFSLLATQLASRIRDTFTVELSLREVFTAPTVDGLAQLIVGKHVELAGADELEKLLDDLE